jgi:hypothetical protein
MTDAEPDEKPDPDAPAGFVPPDGPRRRWRGPTIFSLWFPLALIFTLAAVALLAVTLTQRSVTLPDWVTKNIEARLNAKLGEQGRVKLGSVAVSMLEGLAPTVHLKNIALADQNGTEIAQLAEIQADFDLDAMLKGEIDTGNLSLRGAEITLFRREDGSFAVAFGQSERMRGDLTTIIDQIDRIFAKGPLAAIDHIAISDLTVTVEDARVNRIWQATSGRLDLVQSEGELNAGLTFDVFNGTERLTPVQIAFQADKASSAARITASFTDALSGDISAQSPGLAFLALLDAPIGGSIGLEISETGEMTSFGGVVDIGQGTFAPSTGGGETAVRSGKVVFTFDPELGRIVFDRLTLTADHFTVNLDGQTLLDRPDPTAFPTSLIGQLTLKSGTYDDPDIVPAPISLTAGSSDFRITFKPFKVEIGQLNLTDGLTVLEGKGSASAPTGPDKGWVYQASAEIDQITHDHLLRYWPLAIAPKARGWLAENVSSGLFFDIHAALESDGGAPHRMITWRMQSADVRFMATMPEVKGASGYGMLEDFRFAITAEGGTISPGAQGAIDIAGTTMLIADTRIRPTPAVFDLWTKGELAAALNLLNREPLKVMDKAGQPETLATGALNARTSVNTILAKGVPLGDISWEAMARLSGVVAPELVPTGVLTSDDLSVAATPDSLVISGPMKLDAVPLTATFSQMIGAASDGRSEISGSVTLGPEFVKEFAIGLPKNSVTGAGQGEFKLSFAKGEDIRFALNSTLGGLGLRLEALSWSKSAKSKGLLSVEGRLAGTPVIDTLKFDAAGLKADGAITVAANGGLETAEFASVKIGNWFDGPVTLTGRGRNATPAITVRGGSLDFRRADFGSGAASDGGPMKVNLDRLTVADSITLSAFRGDFTSTARGLDGAFTARLNGGGTISGRVAPTDLGTALLITSDNAGTVLKDSGVAQKVRGGAMELRLRPSGAEGTYIGTLNIDRFSVHQMPVLAELLSAISGIGLLQKLTGDGIPFDVVEADFTLTPTYIQIDRASAVGPSMGVAAEGAYTLGSGAMNIRGTIAPIYFVNGVGQLFGRKGGGLFSFNFKIKGTTEDPQVQVNPLSILTPGLFKEMFRRPPPKPVQ